MIKTFVDEAVLKNNLKTKRLLVREKAKEAGSMEVSEVLLANPSLLTLKFVFKKSSKLFLYFIKRLKDVKVVS